MENDIKVKSKKRWWKIFLIIGLIWYLGNNLKHTNPYSEFAILVISILSGFVYYPLKEKLRYKNEKVKSLVTILIIYFGSAILIGVFTNLLNKLAL